jgi:hypothetical protein
MKAIYKYPLSVTDEQHILMPEGAEVLSVQTQHGEPFLWALVKTDKPNRRRTFHIYGTGNPVPDDEEASRFIGTFQILGGGFVGHVFEK